MRRALTPIGAAPCTGFTSISTLTPSRRFKGRFGVPVAAELIVKLGVTVLMPVEVRVHLFDDEDGSLIREVEVAVQPRDELIECRVRLPEELPACAVLVLEGRVGDTRCGAERYVFNDEA